MACKIIVGYRFNPNDAELLVHYLLKKMKRQPLPSDDAMIDCNIYDKEGEEWLDKLMKSKDRNLYCFTKLTKKATSLKVGAKVVNRVTKSGTWKETQKVKEIYATSCDGDGNKKLQLHLGSKRGFKFVPKNGLNSKMKGKILMHEYRLDDDLLDKEKYDNNLVACHLKYELPEKESSSSVGASSSLLLPSTTRNLLPVEDHGRSLMMEYQQQEQEPQQPTQGPYNSTIWPTPIATSWDQQFIYTDNYMKELAMAIPKEYHMQVQYQEQPLQVSNHSTPTSMGNFEQQCCYTSNRMQVDAAASSNTMDLGDLLVDPNFSCSVEELLVDGASWLS